jgi:uncharacterized protein with HEPN domain
MPPPLDERDHGLLLDIAFYGRRAIKHRGDLDQAAFSADAKTIDAVLRCVQNIGEAVWKLSDGFKSQRSSLPWHAIAGLRHRLVHEYGAIDPIRIHGMLVRDLPLLIAEVDAVLAGHGEA